MTPEERRCWERRRYEARLALREISPVRKKLKELSEAYDRIFVRQFCKFAEADERLAMEDGRFKKISKVGVKPKTREYTAEELLRIMSRDQALRLQSILATMREEQKDASEQTEVPVDAGSA